MALRCERRSGEHIESRAGAEESARARRGSERGVCLDIAHARDKVGAVTATTGEAAVAAQSAVSMHVLQVTEARGKKARCD
jgi:hypothetical protein